jgi:hypothetical protein
MLLVDDEYLVVVLVVGVPVGDALVVDVLAVVTSVLVVVGALIIVVCC